MRTSCNYDSQLPLFQSCPTPNDASNMPQFLHIGLNSSQILSTQYECECLALLWKVLVTSKLDDLIFDSWWSWWSDLMSFDFDICWLSVFWGNVPRLGQGHVVESHNSQHRSSKHTWGLDYQVQFLSIWNRGFQKCENGPFSHLRVTFLK